MRRLIGILIAGVLIVVPQTVGAGVTGGGGTGILDIDTPETLPAGRLSLSLAPRYGYLDASQSRLHTFVGNAGVTLGLSSGLEASAVFPLHALFRTDTDAGAGAIFEEDFSFRVRDVELKLRKAFPVGGERLRFALQAVGTAPLGSDRLESIYAPGDSVSPFSAGEWNYGAMALVSLDLTGPTGNVPVRLHLNTGYYLNRNENDYRYRSAFRYPLPVPAPTESKQNDLLLLGAGIEFPLGRLSGFGEVTTEQLVNQRDLLRFMENPIYISGGLRFLFPGGVGLTTGLSLNLSSDDDATAFDPGTIYSDWEARVAISFGDILQSRRQRLAGKEGKTREPETVIRAEASKPETGSSDAPSPGVSPEIVPESPVQTETKPEATKPKLEVETKETPASPALATDPQDKSKPTPVVVDKPTPTPAKVPGPIAAPSKNTEDSPDWDGDGILDTHDRCPRRAEDWDGFRDYDGCPDLDNDQDGILDVDDLCPNSPEDFLAPNPNDGCPTPFRNPGTASLGSEEKPGTKEAGGKVNPTVGQATDSRADTGETTPRTSAMVPESPRAIGIASNLFPDADGDLIPDDRDRCPLKAEDPDGWEDEDGCPDLDNDGDGIPDIVDQCPNAAETWNGFRDDDGCPDVLPENSTAAGTSVSNDRVEALSEEQRRLTSQLADLVLSMQSVSTSNIETPLNPQADWDDDGVGDLHDRCPEIKEDVDGWQDEDGCPDLDNDGDGIPDVSDRCPNAAETWNGYEDDDGCPDTKPAPPQSPPVVKTAEPLPPAKPSVATTPAPTPAASRELLLIVYFPSGGATLDAFAQGSLHELVLDRHQYSGRTLEIAGFSDSQGSETVNLRLSRSRAQQVIDYLVEAGISRSRLLIAARGEADPVADNAAVEGRARNRRVEIRVLPESHGDQE